ncbi:MAG: cytochrome C [Sulfuricella sp.]|nr:cytochrome C [Sulfuricella sp.]
MKKYTGRIAVTVNVLIGLATLGLSFSASALPLFARQTGQNCVSCHAGGQFPELTPYGRMFKLTGFTMGTRVTVPLAVMGVASMTKESTNGSIDPSNEYPKNGEFSFTTMSVFAGGKITDNIGLFGQWTYNAYAFGKNPNVNGNNTEFSGHSGSDQFDLRYADRFVDANRDLIVGASLNNNPGVTDVWNTFNSAFGAVPGYVPVSNANGVAGSTSPVLQGLGPYAAGKNVYAYWNKTLYAELGSYSTANGIFSFLSQGISDANMGTKLKGENPYFRVALNKEWGAHSAMIGLHGMNVDVYSAAPDTSSPTNNFKDLGIDGQYQYILDPHMVSAQFSYTHEKQSYDSSLVDPTGTGAAPYTNASNTLDYLRLKGTYVYQAKYGASLGYVDVRGSADSNLYAANTSGGFVPNTTYWIPEVFWTPVQNIRVGAQYYSYTKFNGASTNYTTNSDTVTPRDAKDNNMLFAYIWAAY